MVRASWVLNRQLMVIWAAFCWATEAQTSRRSASSSGSRCFRQERDSTLNSISARFNQLPCLGVLELQPFRNPPRLGCREGLVQGRHPVGVQVVQDHPDHRDLWVGFIHQPAHLLGEILHRAPFSNRHMAPAGQGFTGQEQVAGSLPTVLVVLPLGQSRLGEQRRLGLGQQLG